MFMFLFASCEKDTDPVLLAPVLTVEEPGNLSRTVATLKGKLTVTDMNAVVEVGFKIGEASDLGDSKEYAIDDFSIGELSVDVQNLEIGKTYFYALYARNGITEQLSQIKAFTTLTNSTALPGEVTVDEGTGKWSSSILDDGGSAVTTKGFCWDVDPNPTVFKNRMLVETADFSAIAPFLGGGTYYIRAFVQNDKGIGYGKEYVYTIAGPEIPVIINIPDPVFKGYLLKRYDANSDGEIDAEEAANITEIDCDTYMKYNIYTTEGIEACINLKSLKIKGNFVRDSPVGTLNKLDVSKNLKLEILDLYGQGPLEELDLSKNINLTEVNCSGCSILNLDVSNCTKLKSLICYKTPISNLDISQNLLLEELYCGATNLTFVDTSKNIQLKRLHCQGSSISHFEISHNVYLQSFDCESTNISGILDLSNNIVPLQILWCRNCPYLTEIHLKKGQVVDSFYKDSYVTVFYK